MADERVPYRVNIGGIEHTMLLTKQAAAELYGDLAAPVKAKVDAPSKKAATRPANKSRTAQNKK